MHKKNVETSLSRSLLIFQIKIGPLMLCDLGTLLKGKLYVLIIITSLCPCPVLGESKGENKGECLSCIQVQLIPCTMVLYDKGGTIQ